MRPKTIVWLAAMSAVAVLCCSCHRVDDSPGKPAAQHVYARVDAEEVQMPGMSSTDARAKGITSWGEAANDLQAGIAVIGPVQDHPEKMQFRLCQRNMAEMPLRVLEMRHRRRYPRGLYEVTVDGKAVTCQLPVASQPDPPPLAYIFLAPGEQDSVSETLMLADSWDITPPCTAKVRIVIRNERSEIVAHDAEDNAVTVSGLWIATARSGAVAVRVTPLAFPLRP